MSIIAESSTVSYGVCVLALPGVISLNAMVPDKRATTASHVGPGTAPGKPSSPRYKCKQMNVAKLTGMEQHWIAPTSKPTAARWVPVSNLLSGKKGHSTCEWLGYSRGGRTTKLHLLTDGHRRPLSVLLSAGQAFDGNFLTPLLDAMRVPRRGRGRPRKRPTTLRMDRAEQGNTAACCGGGGFAVSARSGQTLAELDCIRGGKVDGLPTLIAKRTKGDMLWNARSID